MVVVVPRYSRIIVKVVEEFTRGGTGRITDYQEEVLMKRLLIIVVVLLCQSVEI